MRILQWRAGTVKDVTEPHLKTLQMRRELPELLRGQRR
jgi:hypothetical protein